MTLVSGRRSILVLCIAFLLFLPATARLHAQAVTAELQGTVMDKQGAGVGGATITVRNTATGIVREIKADDQGRYLASNLQPGPYEVVVSAQGFSKKTFSGITLNVGDTIRLDAKAQSLVKQFDKDGKPIAVICHGGWLPISAGIVSGRTLTSWPSLQDDIRNAGGTWVDEQVHRDRNLISSRKPDDIPAFNQALFEALAERKKAA